MIKLLHFGVAATFLALSACSTTETDGGYGADTYGDGFGGNEDVNADGSYIADDSSISYGSISELSDSMKNTVNFGWFPMWGVPHPDSLRNY